jgi:predicted transcriptional regulator
MTVLWSTDRPITVLEVHRRLAADRQLAYTTVMTVMTRLVRKDLLNQHRGSRAYRYTPAHSRAAHVASVMLTALREAEAGERTAAFMRFLQTVDERELVVLRRALTGLEYASPPAA